MLFIAIAAAISAFELINILYKFNPKVLKTALGYDVWLEIFFSVVLTVIAAGTGSMTALVIAVVTGFFITITLHCTKHIVGYRKYVKDPITKKRSWVEYPGTTTATSFGGFTRLLSLKIFDTLKSFAGGLISGKKNTTPAAA